MNEDELVEWFKRLYEDRTPARSVLDADPRYRVTWTEIWDKMRRLGYGGDVVDGRRLWHQIFDRRKIKRWCNVLLRDAGELVLPRQNAAERDAARDDPAG